MCVVPVFLLARLLSNLQFRAPYDLLEKVKPEAGPSRRTRGTRSEQLSILSGLSFSSPKPPSKPMPRGLKNKLPSTAIQEIISSTRGKVQEKEKRVKQEKHKDSEEVRLESPDVPSVPKTVSKKPLGIAEGERTVSVPIAADRSARATASSISAPARRTKAKDPSPARPISVIENLPTKKPDVIMHEKGLESISAVLGRRSGRLRGTAPEEPPVKRVKIAAEPLNQVSYCYIRLRCPFLILSLQEPTIPKLPPRVVKSIVKPPKPPEPEPPVLSPPPHEAQVSAPLKIKRIKLLVRRPPPSLTHHKQRPPPPKFNSSLSNFLTSFRMLGDEEVDSERIAKRALEEARIREREADFRRQGRFIPGTDVLFGTEPSTIPYDPPKRTTRDIWDDIVEIISTTRSKVPKKTVGQQVAAQIASKVQAYWDTQGVKRDKARAQEERRLRALAKATMKMVNAEWKKAVHVCDGSFFLCQPTNILISFLRSM